MVQPTTNLNAGKKNPSFNGVATPRLGNSSNEVIMTEKTKTGYGEAT